MWISYLNWIVTGYKGLERFREHLYLGKPDSWFDWFETIDVLLLFCYGRVAERKRSMTNVEQAYAELIRCSRGCIEINWSCVSIILDHVNVCLKHYFSYLQLKIFVFVFRVHEFTVKCKLGLMLKKSLFSDKIKE